jgi:hypothetical protein
MTLTSAEAIANIRTDLSDTDSASYRWTDAAIEREIDRTIARYSAVSPYLLSIQLQTVPRCKIYPSPAGAWWVDRVEYPLGCWPKAYQPFKERLSPLVPDPGSAPGVVAAAPGSIDAGTYSWAHTYTVPGGGETGLSPSATLTLGSGGALVTVAPPPYGVTGVTIYRTRLGGTTFFLVASIITPTEYSFTDTLADSDLGAAAPSANTTRGIPQFEIGLSPYALPQDSSSPIEVTYAAKHSLDSSGTTIPEEHHDILYAGAEAYLVESYLSQVNDNFEYVDGQFRDRVDDTKSIAAWQAFLQTLQRTFELRLKDAENQANDSITLVGRWGDKPYAWDRL